MSVNDLVLPAARRDVLITNLSFARINLADVTWRCNVAITAIRIGQKSTISLRTGFSVWTTVSRELSRNRGRRGYRPKQAHDLAVARHRDAYCLRITAQTWARVETLVRQ